MGDDKSTEPTENVETPEPDEGLNILEDTEGDNETEETTEVEETPKETETKETETKETSEETEADETSEEEESDDETLPEGELDEKEIARRRYEERQRVKAERQARVDKTAQEYLSEAESEQEQRLRSLEIMEHTRNIEHNENTLISDFERAKANPDLKIFDPDSESFNQKAYEKTIRDFDAGYLVRDTDGNLTGIKGSLYDYLKETAELLQGATKTGAVQQVKATRKMRANADSKPAASPKEPQKDVILDILKSED